ncbi:glycosyltransferase [Ensifer sp. Root423]|uniref:glycosyltransferase n=1 Tax=Ensifer sp. Root423 TaxID=1736534 RepID=UPI000AC1A542|nr:glycosyltransferase [Ensifer sp. Root423]
MSAFERKSIILACPLYRRADLLGPLIASIEAITSELNELSAKVLFIVDSPDDHELLDALERHVSSLARIADVQVHINDRNIGFLKSANIAIKCAIQDRHDLILLNSDVELFPGAVREMKEVAYSDHMIGFVSPRSNNATICSLPVAEAFRHMGPKESYANYTQLKGRLTQLSYVPVAVGFCLYIKHSVLSEFGGFDEVYGLGYNEENDLILRANRSGYRAAIANHAFVYHVGESSFSLLNSGRSPREARNSSIFNDRYPEYKRSISRYMLSADHVATALLDGLIPNESGKLHVGFDMRSFGCYHNGTFEAAFKILESFSRRNTQFALHIISKKEVYNFHDFDRLADVKWCDIDDQRPLAAIVRIGQPFKHRDIHWLRRRAPISLVFMLDTIALDATYLDEHGLQHIWDLTLRSCDAVFYNSRYTANQFDSRFDIPSTTKQIVALHSTSAREYVGSNENISSTAPEEDYVLLVGNEFHHKFVRETITSLLEGTKQRFVVMGIDGNDSPVCRYLKSGKLTGKQVDELYAGAKAIVFPSHYEGFGFPILNALAARRPILARKMPVYEEIKAHSASSSNVHLYSDTNELISILQEPPSWSDAINDAVEITWNHTSDLLASTLQELVQTQTHRELRAKLSLFETCGTPADTDRGFLRALGKMTCTIGQKLRRRSRRLLSPIFNDAAAVQASPFFDQTYYRETYSDMLSVQHGHARHFCRYGWREGRNPGPLFDVEWYIEQNTDVKRLDTNPLMHYLQHGFFEGRPIKFVDSGHSVVLGQQ